jgi:hypothetical protein
MSSKTVFNLVILGGALIVLAWAFNNFSWPIFCSSQSAEYLDTVERCAIALGHKLSAQEWETVWQNRREIGAYSVLVELKIVAALAMHTAFQD